MSPDWLRLAGATLSRYRAGGWVEATLKGTRLSGRAGRSIALAEGPGAGRLVRAEIALEREGGNLFLPLGATTVSVQSGVAVTRDPSGSLRVPRHTPLPLEYAVAFDPARVVQPPPDDTDVELPPASDRLRDLATAATQGTTNRLAAALAIEQYLQTHYGYSLRSNAPVRQDPVQWFLFSAREGHCEFFASSMVLLLRTLGIPARLQAGYIGGESLGNGSYLVRESNAHAWVLAYVEGRWRVFDPTPPEGRPGVLAAGGTLSVREAWDRFESAWDRWVLTFSLSDQLDIASGFAEAAVNGARGALPVAGGAAGFAALAWLSLAPQAAPGRVRRAGPERPRHHGGAPPRDGGRRAPRHRGGAGHDGPGVRRRGGRVGPGNGRTARVARHRARALPLRRRAVAAAAGGAPRRPHRRARPEGNVAAARRVRPGRLGTGRWGHLIVVIRANAGIQYSTAAGRPTPTPAPAAGSPTGEARSLAKPHV